MFFRLPQNVYVNINRIMSVGNRLLEAGHYASQQIKQISGQLEQEWKAFAAALDERSALLEMSATFHQKCDQVRENACNIFVCVRVDFNGFHMLLKVSDNQT